MLPSLKVDEGATESESAEMAQTAQLQNTNCLGRNLGKPLGAECSADTKKKKRESEEGVGAVGQYEMMGALGRQLLSAGLGGPHGLCAAEREMHDVAIMGASVRCGDGAVGSVCQRPAAWHDMETLVRHRPAHAGETIRFQPLPLSRAIASALRHNRRGRGQHAYGAVHAGRLALTTALVPGPNAQVYS